MDGSPTIRRRQLGLLLRSYREAAGIKGTQAGRLLGKDQAYISRAEGAKQTLPPDQLDMLLDAYEVPEADRDALRDLRGQAERRDWWTVWGRNSVATATQLLLSLEPDALELRSYETELVPGLLQTEGYARALMTSGAEVYGVPDAEVERRVRVRIARKEILMRARPVQLHAVINEAVLRRPIGGREVFADQLRYLLDIAERPNVTIQVLPFSTGAHPALGGSFELLRFPPGVMTEVAYVSSLNTATYLEDDDVAGYTVMFDRLRLVGLGAAESHELIAEAVKQYQ